jgi:hypothetical protein
MARPTLPRLALTLSILLASASAAASDNLFKSYAYGAPLAIFTDANGYYDCSADVGGVARCLDHVNFIGHAFTAALGFSGSKLTTVSLISAYDQSLYAQAATTLGKTFRLSALSDTKSRLDVVQLEGASASQQVFASKFAKYEADALNAGTLTYTFFEGVDRNAKFPNVTSLMAASPNNVRAAELMVTSAGGEPALLIRFSFPKLEASKGKAF